MSYAYVIAHLRDEIAYHRSDYLTDPEHHAACISEIEAAISFLEAQG